MIYITGGERSGKSSFAQKLALTFSGNPVYLATAKAWDGDFKKRIERHQLDRGKNWTTIEEEKNISKHDFSGKVVVLDCVTLWLTNFYTDNDFNPEITLEQVKTEFDKLIKNDFTLIVVSNEIGMGIHAATESSRKFTEIQGRMNQHIAKHADEVYLMVSGIPVKIK